MADETFDATDARIKAALHQLHEGFEVPGFDDTWAAASASASRPEAAGRRRLAVRALAAGAAALAAGIIFSLLPGSESTNADLPLSAARLPAGEVLPMWYAPTDELLQISSLSYAGRPATLTTYDPINLELR